MFCCAFPHVFPIALKLFIMCDGPYALKAQQSPVFLSSGIALTALRDQCVIIRHVTFW